MLEGYFKRGMHSLPNKDSAVEIIKASKKNISARKTMFQKVFVKMTGATYIILTILVGFLVLLWGPAAPVYAQGSVNFSKVSELEEPVPGFSNIVLAGKYAYCVSGSRLDILDISKPTSPVPVGSYKCPESKFPPFYGISVLNNRAYSVSRDGLNFLDISNRANPVYLGKTMLPEVVTSFCISGEYAFVGGGWDETIYIVNISGTGVPSSYITYNAGAYIHFVYASGNYLYVATMYDNSVLVLDISNPTKPKQVTEISCTRPMGIYVSGKYAYIITADQLLIYDISKPQAPVKIGTYNDNISYSYYRVYVSGSLAYLSDNGHLDIVDVGNPAQPVKKAEYKYPGHVTDFVSSNNLVYIADIRGLRIVDITDPTNPSYINSLEHYGRPNSIAAAGNYLYMGKDYGLRVVNISSPVSPTWSGAVSIDDFIGTITVNNNFLYAIARINDNWYFRIYNLSNPSKPVKVGEILHPTYAYSYIKIIGNYAYVGGEGKLVVYNVSNPATPVQTRILSQHSFQMATYGSYGYLSSIDKLIVLDISSPSSPVILNRLSTEPAGITWARSIAIKDKYAYVGGEDKIALYDLSNPSSPKLVKKFHSPEDIYSIRINGNNASFHGSGTIEIANLANPLLPKTTGYYWEENSQYYFANCAEKNNYYFLMNPNSSELTVFKYAYAQSVPGISLSRSKLYFGALPDTNDSFSQTVHVSSTDYKPVSWYTSEDTYWIFCMTGANPGSSELIITINSIYISPCIPGIYSGIVTVHNRNSIFDSHLLTVQLQIYDPANTSVPFGEMATPVNNSVVSGSIPVTGWVLDDINVESVEIYLDNNGTQNRIGYAVFVEGARPDVEQVYPTYPYANKAGWGYMLLTNFLPGQGNGTFKLQAIATDYENNKVTLGSKTIICDNANAKKPFGSIDTPAQGGTAWGDAYINWGWALTPQPNAIPIDGSTITVYVNGVPKGNPIYNNYRKDIATLFPGYANTNGAVGYFYLDTTKYNNGIYTIQWTVTDNAGNKDGIGSRYFTISNSGNSRQTSSAATNLSNNGMQNQRVYSKYSDLVESSPKGQIPVNNHDALLLQKDSQPGDQPQSIYADENSDYLIKTKELDRIEITFTGESMITAGYSQVGAMTRPLPLGSTLNLEENKFYWSIGHGFVGQYHLTFIEKDGTGGISKKNITILIEP